MTELLSWPVAFEQSQPPDSSRHRMPILRMGSLAGSREAMPRAAAHLTAAETARSLRFVRQADRERFIMGRVLAKSMLEGAFGIERSDCAFEAGTHGKPSLRGRPDIGFSIAHSGDLVLVGIGKSMEIGVDVERHRDDVEIDGVSGVIFTPAEREAVLRGPLEERRRRFFRHWTLKEALVKALGTGLLLEPRRFSIEQSAAALQVTFVGDGPDDVGSGWMVKDVPVTAGYSASLAWRCLDIANTDGRFSGSKHG